MADTRFSISVTGGHDPLIRLWNPFFSKKPVWLMKGHQTSVTHVLVSSRHGSILSVSKDKVSSGSSALPPAAGPCSPAEMLARGQRSSSASQGAGWQLAGA